jgi:hypothetical protein
MVVFIVDSSGAIQDFSYIIGYFHQLTEINTQQAILIHSFDVSHGIICSFCLVLTYCKTQICCYILIFFIFTIELNFHWIGSRDI